MGSSEEVLEQAARDGSIDISEWPRVLENVLQRLHDIVHNDFPLPQIPASAAAIQAEVDSTVLAASPIPSTTQSSDPPASLTQQSDDAPPDSNEGAQPLSQSSVTTNKENAPPTRPPVPSFSVTPHAASTRSLSQPPPPDSPLPPDLLSSYQSSTNILRNTFSQSPPYTVQRLAELVLQPRKHYRFLPSFLSALDRAVSVTSPVSDFPLAQFHVTGSVGFLTNGDGAANSISERGGLGSDESLGGALLTPIPWIKKREEEAALAQAEGLGSQQELRTEDEETIDGPHGAGRVETVSVTMNGFSSTAQPPAAPTGEGEGDANAHAHEQELRSQGGVTQGELLRQEQTAGVVPVGQETIRHSLIPGGGATAVGRESVAAHPAGGEEVLLRVEDGDKPAEDRPHARGPEEIGMEDTGPQAATSADGGPITLDMEAAAGRKSPLSPRSSEPLADEAQPDIASVFERKEGDPVITEGNSGGVAETAAAAAAAAAAIGEKRKRDGEDDGQQGEKNNEDDEMTD